MKADLITIGDEILIGQIIDTNSAWMAQQLNSLGVNVREITSISDQPEHILKTLEESENKVSIVLVTGGLGPTKDDRTKATICQYFGTTLIEDKQVLEHVIQLLTPRGIVINQLNCDQALVPASAIVLPNKLGTAPGLWIEKNDTIFVFMPGVPFEMQYLMEHEVLPRIRKKFNTASIIHRTILTIGLPESMLAERIADWEDQLPHCISLAYLPSPMTIKLRLSALGEDKEVLENLLEQNIAQLKKIIPDQIFGYNEDTLAGNVGRILKERGLSVSTAESCTGGNIAHFFTSNSGSSDYFKGGIIAYSNEAKTNILGIDANLIKTKGAVSQEVIEEMAVSARKLLNTDFAIATSGIAGPTGGTAEKPVGTVWISVAAKDQVVSKCFNFGNNRERNIIRSTQMAINLLRLQLLNDCPIE